jgi:hypothetical protein
LLTQVAAQLGMARFDRNKFPELFPATLTEFASPVAGMCLCAHGSTRRWSSTAHLCVCLCVHLCGFTCVSVYLQCVYPRVDFFGFSKCQICCVLFECEAMHSR